MRMDIQAIDKELPCQTSSHLADFSSEGTYSTCQLFFLCIYEGNTDVKIAMWQMKAVEKLISGTEIDLAELERRANQPQILKVCHRT